MDERKEESELRIIVQRSIYNYDRYIQINGLHTNVRNHIHARTHMYNVYDAYTHLPSDDTHIYHRWHYLYSKKSRVSRINSHNHNDVNGDMENALIYLIHFACYG